MDKKLVWVGPRESDTFYSGLDFFKVITYNGSNVGNNVSFTSEAGVRIDHNHSKSWDLKSFLKINLQTLLKENDDICFLFYNTLQAFSLGEEVVAHTLGVNPPELLRYMRSKANMRRFAQKYIPVVPFVEFCGDHLPETMFDIGEKDSFILQEIISSAGYGTQQLTRKECADYIADRSSEDSYLLSPYLKYAAPINVHVIIFEDKCIVFPPSFQLIQRNGARFSYIGGDFHANLPEKTFQLIRQRSDSLAEGLRAIGYRGVCGFDYMLTKDELYFIELNPRFQASSFLLNRLLLQNGYPTLHQLNLSARGNSAPEWNDFSRFEKAESFFAISGESEPSWLFASDGKLPHVVSELILDGYSPAMQREENAYLCRVLSERSLCWLNKDFQLLLAPNLQPDQDAWRVKILSDDSLCVKIALLNQGVRFSPIAQARLEESKSIRQGVFQSVDLFLPGGLIVNAPYHTAFSELSPYWIEWYGGAFVLFYESKPLFPISFDSADPYRNRIASHGTLYRNVTFWATDRLRVHHQLTCRFKREGKGCAFCNTKHKKEAFSIDDVCEAVDFYLDHADFRHFLIGGGSGSYEEEHQNILTLVKHIRSRCDKPIYVMCLPPKDVSVLSDYHKAGVDEIGFNLELYDREEAERIMPGKGSIPLTQYENAYCEAVRLWGNRGNVRSMMLLGLEREESFFEGIRWLCQLGVMPILSVFRPVDRILLNEVLPPRNEDLERVFYRADAIAKDAGLALGPFCTACQNNTLSLPIL